MQRLPPRPVVLVLQAFIGLLERVRRALLPPELYLMDTVMFGSVRAHAVFTSVRLGVFEALAEGPRSPAEVAAAIGTDTTLTWRLLRGLASFGVVEAQGDRYGLNGVSRLLLPGTGYREGILLNAEPSQLRVWGFLPDSLRSPKSAFELAYGAPYFEQLGQDRHLGDLFDQAMLAWSEPTIAAVCQAWLPTPGTTVVDVGGGKGHFLASLLAAVPTCKGILFDRPEVVAGAALGDVASRVTRVGGSFFDAVPEGGDTYLLTNILHDWSDADCVTILRRVRAAMRPESRLHVVDIVVPPGNPEHPGPVVDLMMMVLFRDGRERTEAELRGLAAEAGLVVERVIPTITPAGIVVMRPG